MKIVTPETEHDGSELFSVFLAGGITNCPDWQTMVIEELEKFPDTYNLTVINPRCKSFDTTNTDASKKQIQWEYNQLEKATIFSMFFCDGESDQPICMYELGRNLVTSKNFNERKFTITTITPFFTETTPIYRPIIISCMAGYKRLLDVQEQVSLATSGNVKVEVFDSYGEATKSHAMRIYRAYKAHLLQFL